MVLACISCATFQHAKVRRFNPSGEMTAQSAAKSFEGTAKARVVENYGKLPLSFEANRGQSSKEVRFLTHGPGYLLSLTRKEAIISLSSGKSEASSHTEQSRNSLRKTAPFSARTDRGQLTTSVLRMKFVGASQAAEPVGFDELPGKVNYFIGNDPKKWRANIRTYAKVRYKDLYPGIDLVYYGHQGQLEYDFVVAPGADPRRIALAFEGSTRHRVKPLRIDKAGNVTVESGSAFVRLSKPIIYQPETSNAGANPESAAKNSKPVDGRFVLTSSNQVRFEVGPYDKSQPLIIDPALSYSTFLGGTGVNSTASSHGVGAVDSSGNVFIAGLALGGGFTTTSGVFESTPPDAGGDVFVTKINPTGSASVWSTYLGGPSGGPSLCGENGPFLTLDSSNNVYLTGYTTSTTFPIMPANAFQTKLGNSQGCNAFVTKLNNTGSALVYSTYLGGTNGLDIGRAIAVDSLGDAYVAGSASSTDFPTKNAIQSMYGGGSSDAFLAEVNPTGTDLLFSTFLGGTGNDNATSLAIDSAGAIYVSGDTGSSNFPIKSPLQTTLKGTSNAFLTKVAPGGSTLDYSTYLGGSGGDFPLGLVVDSLGNAYLGGETSSADFPTVSAFQSSCPSGANDCVFAAKVNSAGSNLIYSTYLGGSGAEGQFGGVFAVDTLGNAYLSGTTFSPDFPLQKPIQTTYGGNGDAFVTVLNPAGSALVFSTYLGGSQRDRVGNGSFGALDSAGHIYVGGQTESTDYPVLPGAMQASFSGGSAAFIAKIDLSATANPDYLLLPAPNSMSVTPGASAKFNANVMPLGGFNQTVNISCTGAPSKSTCTPSPSSTTLDGADTVPVTVNISTTAGTAGCSASVATAKLLRPAGHPPFTLASIAMLAMGFVTLCPAGRRPRRRIHHGLLVLSLVSLIFLLSCGGGSSVTTSCSGGGGSTGTPAGTYTLTLTGTSGNLSHSTTLSLTVN